METVRNRILLLSALTIGGTLTYIDARPSWDDTGIIAAALFISTGVLGYLGPRRAWLWGLAEGIWIPLLTIVRGGSIGSTLALIIALAGAYLGMGVHRWLIPEVE